MTVQKVLMTDPKQSDYFYEEAIKTLRTNIQFTGKSIKTIVVSSCYPNEGKSDVVFQLAREFGNINKKALVIDADIRKSCYVSRYQIKHKIQGLSQYLSGQVNIEDIIYETNFQDVDMIFAGAIAPNPSELLEEEAFAELLSYVRDKYDYILVDTPPVSNLIDAAIVAKQCDGAILVIESELVSHKVAAKAKNQLERSGCRMLGAVLNKVDVKQDKYYGKYNGYYGKEKK